MTQYQVVYDAFLAKILDDEWDSWLASEAEQDWRQILEGAIPWFKFPRISLERNENGFVNDLGQAEIQVLANFMKCEWLDRIILSWDNIKPLYTERDFSPANMLDKLKAKYEQSKLMADKMESNYYRSINGKPFKFSKLAKND